MTEPDDAPTIPAPPPDGALEDWLPRDEDDEEAAA